MIENENNDNISKESQSISSSEESTLDRESAFKDEKDKVTREVLKIMGQSISSLSITTFRILELTDVDYLIEESGEVYRIQISKVIEVGDNVDKGKSTNAAQILENVKVDIQDYVQKSK